MSKIDTFVFVFVIFIMSACSDSSLNNEEVDNNSLTTSNTLAGLSSFNQDLLDKKNQSIAIRYDCWGSFKRGFVVSAADIMGVGAGVSTIQSVASVAGIATGGTGYVVTCAVAGAICGAGGSIAAYDALSNTVFVDQPDSNEKVSFASLSEDEYIDFYSSNTSPIPGKTSDNYEYNYILSKIEIPTEFESLKRVGEGHNNIVKLSFQLANSKMKSDNFNLRSGIINDVTTPEVSPEALELITDIIYDQEFKTGRKSISSSIEQSASLNQIDPNIFFKKYPLQSKRVEDALKLYLSLYVEFPENLDDIVIIVNNYIDIIEKNNEFTSNEKSIIYSALIVSLYSPQLWN